MTSSAVSRRGGDFGVSRVRAVSFPMRGISRLTLEMTGRWSVPFGCRGGARAPRPTGAGRTLQTNTCPRWLTAGRGTPLSYSTKSKCGHRRLACRGSLSAGRERPALPEREGHFKLILARGGSPPNEERPYHILSKVSTGIADLPTGAPCRRAKHREKENDGKRNRSGYTETRKT